jgi:hypothetical protein
MSAARLYMTLPRTGCCKNSVCPSKLSALQIEWLVARLLLVTKLSNSRLPAQPDSPHFAESGNGSRFYGQCALTMQLCTFGKDTVMVSFRPLPHGYRVGGGEDTDEDPALAPWPELLRLEKPVKKGTIDVGRRRRVPFAGEDWLRCHQPGSCGFCRGWRLEVPDGKSEKRGGRRHAYLSSVFRRQENINVRWGPSRGPYQPRPTCAIQWLLPHSQRQDERQIAPIWNISTKIYLLGSYFDPFDP